MDVKLVLMRAVVDIGSNSTKFLLARTQRGAKAADFQMGSAVTRLGRGVHSTGHFDAEALKDTIHTLEKFAQIFRDQRCLDIVVVGTSAVRDATDRDRLGAEVQRIFNVDLRILSGIEEAEFSMRGAGRAASDAFGSAPLVFCEVGGASSQVGMFDPEFLAHSFQAGAVRCHEGLGLDKIPVSDESWQRAENEIARYFPAAVWQNLLNKWVLLGSAHAVGIGGSLMLAAKVAGAEAKGDRGYLWSRSGIRLFNEKFRKLTLEARLKTPHMDPGRADVMCAALLCLDHILTKIGKEEIFVTGWGLRHGLIE